MELLDDETEAQLRRAIVVLRSVLGRDIVGVYLYGSAILGGLRPTSDIDIFAVLSRPTTSDERKRLVDLLTPLSARRARPATWRPLELTIVVEVGEDQHRPLPRMDFQFGEWLRAQMDTGSIDPPEPDNPDLLVLLAQVHRHGRPIIGPPPADLLGPIADTDLRQAMLGSIDGLLADLDDDTANVLLTLARIWLTLVDGAFAPKDAAADWALVQLPPELRPALQQARDVYLGNADDAWPDADAARECATDLVRRIRAIPLPPGE